MTRREKVTIIGAGGWGERIAAKLVQRNDVDVVLVDERARHVAELGEQMGVAWSSDPDGYLMVSGTARSTTEPGSVIIATPPEKRLELVRQVMQGYGLPPKRLRIEKPLANNADEARMIAELCNKHDTHLTTGFTLLHHPLYEAAFAWMRLNSVRAVLVSGARIGARARHRADAMIDLGTHTASIAAYLGVPCKIVAKYDDEKIARYTTIHLDNGEVVRINEEAKFILVPKGIELGSYTGDALEADVGAWLSDQHRGDAAVGIRAVHIIDAHMEQIAAGVE